MAGNSPTILRKDVRIKSTRDLDDLGDGPVSLASSKSRGSEYNDNWTNKKNWDQETARR